MVASCHHPCSVVVAVEIFQPLQEIIYVLQAELFDVISIGYREQVVNQPNRDVVIVRESLFHDISLAHPVQMSMFL